MRGAFLAVLLAVPGAGQTLLFRGPGVEASWHGGGDLVLVQSGRRVWAFDGAQGLLAEPQPDWIPRPDTLGSADYFDAAGGSHVVVTGTAASAAGRLAGSWELPAPAFRQPRTGPPLRLPLLLAAARAPESPGAGVLLPARPALLVARQGAEELLSLGMGPALRLDPGYGLGSAMVLEQRLPWVLPLPGRPRPQELVVLHGGGGRVVPLGAGAVRNLEPMPTEPGESVLGIPFHVPPLLADLDADGDPDLVQADAAGGAVTLYQDLRARRPGVSRVILTGGLLLASWAVDLDGDGRRDLCLLSMRAPGVLGRLRIVRAGKAEVELRGYPGGPGGPARSPRWTRRVQISLQVSERNGRRHAQILDRLVPLGPAGVLVVRPSGEIRVLDPAGGGGDRVLGTVASGFALRPFSCVRLPGGRVAFTRSTQTGGRVYLLEDT